jgi:hypothetical protein
MPISTTTTLVSSKAPSNFEDLVIFTATITGSTTFPGGPTGTVQFLDGLNLIGTVPLVGLTGATGQAQLQITSLAPTIHTITAIYSGDANFNGSQRTFSQQVLTVSSGGLIPGFAIVGTYSASGDSSSTPAVALSAIPSSTNANVEIILLWNSNSVGQIEITGNNGIDPPFDSGRISTLGSGVYIVGNGFTKTITLTLTAYDATGHPLVPPLTATAHITIS